MAAKASIQDIIDAGFMPAQFGTPSDWLTAETGYLARLLARAERWSRGRYGSAGYDGVAPSSTIFEYLRSAEICWVSAQLWKARAAFIDSNAASSREGMAYLDRREYEASAARALECADENVALALDGAAVPGTGASLTHVETGPFAGAWRGAR